MNILNPPKSYIDYRCYVHGLSGSELIAAQDRFYRKHDESRAEICTFFNQIIQARENRSLPVEKIEVREPDGKKYGNVVSMMIYDIEYWIENGRIRQSKIHMASQGYITSLNPQKARDGKMAAAGEEMEVPF